MAVLKLTIDDTTNERASAVLKQLHLSQNEAIQLFFSYIATHQALPMPTEQEDDEDDAAFIALVQERLDNPQPVYLELHEL